MARFDVYATPGRHADSTPYLLDVQSDLLDGLDSRVVIPLRRRERFPAVPLAPEHARVTAAMDFLFRGFQPGMALGRRPEARIGYAPSHRS